jgi:ABC-type transport system involved in multi-copper enzyme maturation permease subunit
MSATSERVDDFPDRFSPMLVKELRQGLRGKTFVAVFLVLQGLLGLILLTAGAASYSQRAGTFVSQVVFVFFSLAVLVIQPLRGVGALSSEIKCNTIDLMVLTRLSALRIVLGKWVAIISQSALLTATIFPYLILRYYLGGMNLFAELVMVLMIFFLSAGLTALTVGISACRSILIRGLLPVMGAPFLTFCIFGISFNNGLSSLIETCSFSNSTHNFELLGFLILTSYLGWSSLSLGAALIAPMAENHSTLRRLIALGLIACTPFLSEEMNAPYSFIPFFWFLIAAPAIATALSEEENPVPTVYRPFVRKGLFGKLAGRLLYPGWPAGVNFTVIVTLIGIAGLSFIPSINSDELREVRIWMLALIGSLLLPATIIALAGQKAKDRIAIFILLWISWLGLALVINSLGSDMQSGFLQWTFVWDPIILIPMMEMSHSYRKVSFQHDDLLAAGLIVDGLYLLVLYLKSIPAFRRIRELEQP